MSASEGKPNALAIVAGHTYRTREGRTLHVLKVEGFRVWYRLESGLGRGGVYWSSFVDISRALDEDVTP